MLGGDGEKGERRSVRSHKRLLYCVKVNRTSLDHLLLGKCADVDRTSLSHEGIIRQRLLWARHIQERKARNLTKRRADN